MSGSARFDFDLCDPALFASGRHHAAFARLRREAPVYEQPTRDGGRFWSVTRYDDLVRVATAMMSLVDRPRPRVLLVRSTLDRHLYAFVWLPRDALSTSLRRQVQAMVAEAANAPVIDWNLQVDANLAILRFVIDIDDDARTPDEAALDKVLAAMVRGWPAAVEAQHQPGARLGPAVHPGVDAERAAEAVQLCPLGLDMRKARSPDQRTIAKHPKIAHIG